MKKTKKILFIIISLSLFLIIKNSSAQGTNTGPGFDYPYRPGEEIAPTCDPADPANTNCYVDTSFLKLCNNLITSGIPGAGDCICDSNWESSLVYLTSDNNVYVCNGSEWTKTGASSGMFVGLSSTSTSGSISYDSKTGYEAANAMCEASHAGSHMCTTDEILATILEGDISGWDNPDLNGNGAWIAEGPPGYKENANDCNGWKSNSTKFYGAWWNFHKDGGGAGWLINCEQEKPLACCK